MNLQITSVISHLALFPHPVLNDFLLDPGLPVVENVKLLYNILQKVSNYLDDKFLIQTFLF